MKTTVKELIEQRRGYKYLSVEGVSPYQKYQYDLSNRKQLISDCLDEDVNNSCGAGWNLATLQWIAGHCLKLDGLIVECTIPKKATIVLPVESEGNFRTNIIKIKKVFTVDSLFPSLKNLRERLPNYEPSNPITAVKMPPKASIKNVWTQVGAQVGEQVRAQVWEQVWDQVWEQVRDQVLDQVCTQVWAQVWDQVCAQVGAQVWAQVWEQVGAQVCAQVRDQVLAQVGAQVWAQVWEQVWTQVRAQVGTQVLDQVGAQVCAQVREQVGAQVGIIAYYALKLFFNLPYEHPAFDLIRMGIIVVEVGGETKVFGKNGKYLGKL